MKTTPSKFSLRISLMLVLVGCTSARYLRTQEQQQGMHGVALGNWKIVTPQNKNFAHPEILDYASNPDLMPYMYDVHVDPNGPALCFRALPDATTPNTSYSRSELREQMVPGDDKTNWMYGDGEKNVMTGRLSVPYVTTDPRTGKYHRTIVMQIHGKLTDEQMQRLGTTSSDAHAVFKAYWQDGKIRIVTKVLKDKRTRGDALLLKDSWTNDASHYFATPVNQDPFTLTVEVTKGSVPVTLFTLDGTVETKVYDDMNVKKWGSVYENYFQAGNYLQSTDASAEAHVHYYELSVTH